MATERPQDGPIVVVGAGIGGLLIAAGLCRAGRGPAGREVVVLERLPFPGGRFSNIDREGYQLSTGALHTLPFGSRGPMARLLRELAPSCAIRDATHSFHAAGRRVPWRKPLDVLQLFPLPERAQFALLAHRMRWSRRMGDESFGRWVRRHTASPRIYRLLERVMHFGLSAGPDDVPCGEVQRLFRNWSRRRDPGVLVGGCGRVVAALVEAIERGGGTVRTRAEVTQILAQGGAVRGVRARGMGDGHEYVVHTDTVISDAGPKATVALLDGDVPEEAARRVDGLREARGLKFHLASDEPLLPDAGVMFCLDTQRVAGVVQPSHADPGLAPPGKHLLLSHQVMQGDDFARERALGLADLRGLFGDRFEVLSVTAYRGRWPVNRAVQGHDVTRLPVRGLHVVGDGCKAPGYLMVEGVARQVERVLGELAAGQGAK